MHTDDEAPRPLRTDCPFAPIYPSQLVRDDAFFMALAYNQALEAWKHDEVPIGAVIALDGMVVAAAHNRVETARDATAHAEMLAITQAANAIDDWRLNRATLYVTKEPCPMCSGATVMARLGRVVYALPDPKMGCLGGAMALHELPQLNHRVQVTSGVMQDECRALLQAFFEIKRAEAKAQADREKLNDAL